MCLRSFFLLTVSRVLLVLALLLLTVSSGIVCFVSPIVLFIDSIVCFASSGALFLLTVSRESKLSDLINFRGLGIGHLSKTEGSQRELAKSIASCSKKVVPTSWQLWGIPLNILFSIDFHCFLLISLDFD